MIKSIKNMLFSKKAGMVAVFSISAVFALVLVMAPRAKNLTEAFWDCNSAPTEATFNPYQPTEGSTAGTGCHDFPVIAIRNVNGQQGAFSNNISANTGDQLYVRVWVHNGASDTLDRAQTIAHNVSGQISVSGGSISTSFSGNTASGSAMGGNNSGQVSVNLPSGAHLEVVDGSGEIYGGGSVNTNSSGASFYIGDQDACFGFARQIYIKVKVVGAALNPTGQITQAGTTNFNQAACLYNGSVSWTSQNAENVQLRFTDNGGSEQLFHADPTGIDSNINWIAPGHTYQFILYSGNTVLDRKSFTAQAQNCGGTNVAPKVTSFSVDLGQCIAGQNQVNATVNWNTEGFDNIEIWSSDDTGVNQLFSGSESGNQPINWIVPGHNYTFRFYDNNVLIDTKTKSSFGLSCQATSNRSGYINVANGNYQISNQCLSRAVVTWSSTGFSGQTEVHVVSGNSDQIFSTTQTNTSGQNADFINPGQTYTFKLIDTGDGAVIDSKSYTGPSLNCGGNQLTPTGNISVSGGGQVSGQCLSRAIVSWNSANFTQTEVYVSSDNSEQLFSNSQSSTQNADFINPGQSYVFKLVNNVNGVKNIVDIKTYVGPSLTCGSNPPPALTCPAGSVSLSPSILNQGETSAASAPYGWYGGRFVSSNTNLVTISGNSVIAGYSSIGSSTVTGEGWTAPNGATNCSLGWSAITVQRPPVLACVQRNFNTNTSGIYYNGVKTSTLNPNSQFTVKCDYGVQSGYITLDGNNPGQCNFSGWENTAALFNCQGATQPGTYNVSCRMSNNASADNSCSALNPAGSYTVNEPTPNLSCQTLTPNVYTNQTASFSATGGNGSYSWTNGGNPSNGSGSNFNTIFLNAGNKFVTVTSGNQTVNCPVVNVTQPPVSQVTCEITSGSSLVDINQIVSFRASGGNGVYAFNASTGNPATRGASSNAAFSTQYSTSGSKNVTVISDGQIANCPIVTVREPQVPTLSCSAINSPVNVGSTASFTATGGNGSYSWTNGGNPSLGNGQNFSTVYSSAGSKTVTVQSGNQTANCSTQIIDTVVPDVVCTPVNQTANINQTVYFAATGGNGNFNWSAPGSTNGGTTNSSSFNTAYSNSGDKNVTVSSGGKSAVCHVNVLPVQPQTLTCSPNYQTVNIGAMAHFNAIGGTAPYSWQALDSTNQSGAGSSFSTSYTSAFSGATKLVRLTSNDGQVANCQVLVNPPTPTPTPVQTGNCNNSDASCNTNTNTNTSTNNNSTNSSNQNNNSNINGNNNTVTQSNQNCVNNSCNTVYYIQGGNTVSQNDYRQLSIQKMVRNITSSGYQNFQDSVSANNNDTVEFQIIVRNIGNQPVSNVQLTDNLPSGLSYISGQLSGSMNLGTLLANDSKTITFQARVNSNYSYNYNSNQSIQNIAMVRGDSVSQVQDDAWVFVTATTGCTYNCGTVQGSTVNLSYSKKAINETKATYAGQQLDATSVNASREDYITYTLTVTNSGNAAANSFVITDDLSQVLPYADMVDNGGGSLSGNVINFPGITVPAGGSVSKSFKVRVKYSLASNLRYTMTNVYGNTVTIHINNPQVLGAFVAPKTGADTVGISFAMLLTLGMLGFKKRELLSKLILNN